jgi:hypothetical protein
LVPHSGDPYRRKYIWKTVNKQIRKTGTHENRKTGGESLLKLEIGVEQKALGEGDKRISVSRFPKVVLGKSSIGMSEGRDKCRCVPKRRS